MNKYSKLINDIRYSFNDFELLETSLTHSSFGKNKKNNEKLEFLGDRVLGLVISQTLLTKYPAEKEGIIDKKYANLVNKKTCSLIAKKLNLSKFIFLGGTNHFNELKGKSCTYAVSYFKNKIFGNSKCIISDELFKKLKN